MSSDAGAVTRSANTTTSTSRMSTDTSWPQCLQQAALCDDTFAGETQPRDSWSIRSRHRLRARPCTPLTTPPCLSLPVTAANTSTRTRKQGVGAPHYTMMSCVFAAVVCVLVGLSPARIMMAEIDRRLATLLLRCLCRGAGVSATAKPAADCMLDSCVRVQKRRAWLL